MIHLTYSPHAAHQNGPDANHDTRYLHYLDNQREELKNAILQAPRHRLDNLATFVETHSERLTHFLETLISYRRKVRLFQGKFLAGGLVLSLLVSAAVVFGGGLAGLLPVMSPDISLAAGGGLALLLLVLWMTVALNFFSARFKRTLLSQIDDLTPLETQTRRDNWEAIRQLAVNYLKKSAGRFSSWEVNRDYNSVRRVTTEGSREIREVLNEMASVSSSLSDPSSAEQAPVDRPPKKAAKNRSAAGKGKK